MRAKKMGAGNAIQGLQCRKYREHLCYVIWCNSAMGNDPRQHTPTDAHSRRTPSVSF